MYLKRIVSTVVMVSTLVGATDLSTAETDSLQRELQRVNEQLKLYEPAPVSAPEPVAVTPTIAPVVEKQKKEREPGFGGGGGFTIGFKSMDVSNLSKSIEDDLTRLGEKSPYHGLNLDKKLDDKYKTTMMFGVQGLAGIGNGFRIGGGVYGGSTLYRSIYNEDVENDSLYSLVVWDGYGGFILEKSFNFDKANIMVGTLIGGGAQGAVLFNEDDEYDDTDSSSNDLPYELAVSFVSEIHTGVSYSFTKWFHIGLEFSGALFVSNSGYKSGESFTTFNPGGNFRFMFGRIS